MTFTTRQGGEKIYINGNCVSREKSRFSAGEGRREEGIPEPRGRRRGNERNTKAMPTRPTHVTTRWMNIDGIYRSIKSRQRYKNVLVVNSTGFAGVEKISLSSVCYMYTRYYSNGTSTCPAFASPFLLLINAPVRLAVWSPARPHQVYQIVYMLVYIIRMFTRRHQSGRCLPIGVYTWGDVNWELGSFPT
jgi:hypothetical protein